jgi:hypothetical protein
MLKESYCRAVAGTYSWTFDGKALILKAVNDPCADRRITLVVSPWRKEP